VDAALADPEMARGVETILLVEDEDMVRRLVRRALEGCGYVVLEAPDGETALEICRREGTSIALVITDVVMPKLSGRDLIEQLSISHPSLRVLYISGYTDKDVIHHGGLEDVTYFLQKPFTMRALTAKVREILDD
jgi:DNA-binding response OmpR family regulator